MCVEHFLPSSNLQIIRLCFGIKIRFKYKGFNSNPNYSHLVHVGCLVLLDIKKIYKENEDIIEMYFII